MSDRDESLDLEEFTTGDRPLALPDELPILPLRDTVLFPNSFMPLAVARESSVRLIDEAISAGKLIGVFTQRDAGVDDPLQPDLYDIGTASHIHKMFKLPDGSLRLIVQGLARIRLVSVLSTKPYLRAQIEEVPDVDPTPRQLSRLAGIVRSENVRAIFVEPRHSARQASQLGRDLRVPIGVLDTLETGPTTLRAYEEGMEANLRNLQTTLK